jgi:outer membrane protein TolC
VLLALAAVPGCAKECFLSEDDYHAYHEMELPPNVTGLVAPPMQPEPRQTPAPATVIDTRRSNRYLSLREALAIALENGTVGLQSSLAHGSPNENLVSLQGTSVVGSDSIRVLALAPAMAAADIEASLAKFDAAWITSAHWTRSDEPTGGPLPLLQPGIAPVPGISGIIPPGNFVLPNTPGIDVLHADTVGVGTGLIKPLPTGGVAGITFTTDYERTQPSISAINPAYRPSLQFEFEQPLLQGFGVEINQLLDQHPSAPWGSLPQVSRVEGILITRLRLDQQRAEFERSVNYLLLNVETAYWNLYSNYYQLYSREEAMRVAFEVYRLNKARLDLGKVDERDLSLSRLEYEKFRSERLAALAQVLEGERELRGLLGLPTEDGTRLIPSDSPTVAPFQPDWATSLEEALSLRPELLLARQDLKFRQLDLIRQKNRLLPDLRLLASYNLHSLGGQIDGGDRPDNAFHELISDPFGTLSLGMVMSVRIGNRDARAAVRATELALARSYEVLRSEEGKAERYLALQYRQVLEFHEQIGIRQAVREAATRQLEIRFKQFELGREQMDLLLDAQREWADALATEYTAIVQYNNALANLQFACGTIMRYNKVLIAEGPLPQCVQVQAVEHEREMTQALVSQECAKAVAAPSVCAAGATGIALPKLPTGVAISLPALLPGVPPAPPALPGPVPAKPATLPPAVAQAAGK